MLKIHEGYKLNDGRVISVEEMVNISNFYERACTQEYIVENMNLSEEVAWKVACEARDIMSDYDNGDEELDAISEAMDNLDVICGQTKVSETNEFYVYFPEVDLTYAIAEGSGENLSLEDRKEGYIDYIYYEGYKGKGTLKEYEGGFEMLKEYFQDKFEIVRDVIEYIIDAVELKVTEYEIFNEDQIEAINEASKNEKKKIKADREDI